MSEMTAEEMTNEELSKRLTLRARSDRERANFGIITYPCKELVEESVFLDEAARRLTALSEGVPREVVEAEWQVVREATVIVQGCTIDAFMGMVAVPYETFRKWERLSAALAPYRERKVGE